MTVQTIAPAEAWPTSPATLRIDFLFLDLTTCTRCRGTDRSLETALTVVADVLQAAGVAVEVAKVQVVSEERARALRFVSSPTIRINGTDIALELRESSCGSEACTDGCGGSIDCRVWVHRGREYTEPPVALIVDAILRQVYGTAVRREPTGPYRLPENLRRFFTGRAAGAIEAAAVGCCPPADQDTCCDPAAKPECCGGGTDQGCGCR